MLSAHGFTQPVYQRKADETSHDSQTQFKYFDSTYKLKMKIK